LKSKFQKDLKNVSEGKRLVSGMIEGANQGFFRAKSKISIKLIS